eukprot:scaffold28988_cov101-Isochrysis_galbana.AAC.1
MLTARGRARAPCAVAAAGRHNWAPFGLVPWPLCPRVFVFRYWFGLPLRCPHTPSPHQVFAYIVVFALVFRTQAAYGRFVDGCVTVTAMSSRWGDAAMCLLTFDTQAWEGPDGSAAEARASAVRAQVTIKGRGGGVEGTQAER